jgi:phosphatidylserine synthase
VPGDVQADYRLAFLWLCRDAHRRDRRRARARRRRQEHVPHFDGARLDDIVDYLTYVFAPVFLMYRAGVLPETWGVAVAAVVLLSSAYGFASTTPRRMTTSSPAFRLTGISWRLSLRGGLPQASTPRSCWC